MFNTNVSLLTFINNKSVSIVQVLNGRSLIMEYNTHTLAISVTLSILKKKFKVKFKTKILLQCGI